MRPLGFGKEGPPPVYWRYILDADVAAAEEVLAYREDIRWLKDWYASTCGGSL